MAAEQQSIKTGAPLSDCTAFQRDLLSVVAALEVLDGEQYEQPIGADIQDALDQSYNERINHGRFYQNLRELSDEGLVEKGVRDGRTNCYQLSEDGRTALVDHIEWQEAMLNGE